MGFSETSILVKIALIVSVVAFLLHVIGFSTIGWLVTDVPNSGTRKSGLWQIEFGGETRDISDSMANDELKATRAFECLGLIAGVACIVLIVLYMFIKTEKMINLLSAVTGIAAGVLIFIGVIIYGTQEGAKDFGYSFGLTIVGGILYVATGVLILMAGIMAA